MTKDEKLQLVGFTIIHDYVKAPHKKLNINSIAKKCKVSRPWIYKYFGPDHEQILLSAIDSRASDLAAVPEYGSKLETKRDWMKFFLKNLDFTLVQVEKYPEVITLYLYSQLYPSIYGERFKFHEQRLLERVSIPAIRQTFKFSAQEARNMAEMIHSLRMGLCLKWLQEKEKKNTSLKFCLVNTKS